MTDEELNAIKARVEAATPGPWEHLTPNYIIVKPGVNALGEHTIERDITALGGWGAQTDLDADAAFIAHARTDMPALLAEVAAWRAIGRELAVTPVRTRETLFYPPSPIEAKVEQVMEVDPALRDTARALLGEGEA